MFEKRKRREKQSEFWVQRERLPAAVASAFYRRGNATLEKMDFARQVWAICEPAYADPARGGRAGIDPVVYLKMLMIGFFENLPSDRAIAARCEESLSARGFLGYGLEEATPDHSSFTVIRDRLSLEQLEVIHRVLLVALRGHGLLRGRKLGIDCQRPPALPFGLPAAGYLAPLGCSVIEANASLRALEHRNTEDCVPHKRLPSKRSPNAGREPKAKDKAIGITCGGWRRRRASTPRTRRRCVALRSSARAAKRATRSG